MKKGSVKELLKAIFRDFSLEYVSHLQEVLPKLVHKEAKLLCRSSDFSVSPKEVSAFSFSNQYTRVKQTTSLIETVVRSIAQNPRNRRNKVKRNESCLPAIVTAVSTLLFSRNRQMNCMPFIITCVLRRGQAKKEVYGRLV